MTVQVIVHEAEEGGFWAEVPALPGCATQGETLEELEFNIKDAITGCLAVSEEAFSRERLAASGSLRVLEVAV
jgi:predicted RNase H-like HicB family nuclease